jgi:hypothetical protein
MNRLQKILIAAVLINAVVYLLVHPWHGTALNGKTDGGKYYLGSHGNYWEVTRESFIFCTVEEYVAPLTLVLFFSALWFSRPKERRPDDVAA